MAKSGKETPLMKQYNRIKTQHPGAILLFRVGDFYETFGEDAIKSAEILGITLTKRANGAASHIELAGFPHHALDLYLPKLVRAGQRVAICDQLEDPKMTKKLVKRGVTELVTPGVSLNDKVLDHKSNNYLAAVHLTGNQLGVAFCDVSTGEFLLAQGNQEYIEKLIQSFNPAEILYQKGLHNQFEKNFGKSHYTNILDEWVFQIDFAQDILLKHFETSSLKGFGIEKMQMGIISAGVILHYLNETKHPNIKHISSLGRIDASNYVWLDKFTIRNLEILDSAHESGTSLLKVIDKTLCPMGARLLRKWLVFPLKKVAQIQDRQNIVSYFLKNESVTNELQDKLKQIGDLERLISKVATGRVNPREAVQLKKNLQIIPEIKQLSLDSGLSQLVQIAERLNPCPSICQKLEQELNPEAPVNISKGNIIRNQVNAELDELRKLKTSSQNFLDKMLQREIQNTGIPSLKINFNNVFGYYIEVRNTHKDKVPEEWIRKQTLVSAERYITEELKEYETKILGAEEKIQIIEERLFQEIVNALMEFIQPIQLNAQLIARLDCLQSFAEIAQQNNYCQPEINETKIIDIKEGRHPVIEKQLPLGEAYIANDVFLDDEKQQIIIITGPNMSGKSALLRQTALIVLMAQMGSFVPAKFAKLGITDKVFTRVGATDNISSGESTFMVEMNETASILNNLSERSLILLDEIGRGTSTYDGISIAWAITEFIHQQNPNRAKTLFATHYHELNEMEKQFPRIQNYNFAVKELDQKIIFIRKLKKGGSEHSFGIHVAKLAGVPQSIVLRANEILADLESRKTSKTKTKIKAANQKDYQLSLFQMDSPELLKIKDLLESMDINTLTPVEALFQLNRLKDVLKT